MSIIEIRISGRYKLGPKIRKSNDGNIYMAKNVQSNSDVAIKMEEIKRKNPKLLYEAKVLQSIQGGIGVPTLYWSGQEADYNIMVMELLGQNLQELLDVCKVSFSLKTVLILADQLLSNLEYIHFKNYVYRDVKPENFLAGLAKKSHLIYTVNFGLAKRYRDPINFEHIPFKENKPHIGAVRYSSINAHKGFYYNF